jgi:hypothetical protein
MSSSEDKPGEDKAGVGDVGGTQNMAHTINVSSSTEMMQVMQGLQQLIQQMQQQQQAANATTQRLENEIAAQRRLLFARADDHATHSAADTLPAPMSAIKPRAAERRAASGASDSSEPRTPPSGGGGTDRDSHSARVGGASSRHSLKDVLSMVKGFVEPFYADSAKDKGTTVMDFVEKVESAMSDVLDGQTEYRLVVVRMFVREGALRWLNRKIQELKDTGVDTIEWDQHVRRAFIEAHLGTDTVELWLAKLATLRLGKGKATTPIELDSQFDTIARHVYPTMTADDKGVDLLLTTQYRDIIAASNKDMFKTIVRTQPHASLKEWKLAVATQWNAEAQIRAMEGQDRAPSNDSRGGGGSWRGRGGRGGYSGDRTATAAGAGTTDGAGMEGQQHRAEGEPSTYAPQLSAADSQRGGRGGGRGGRGGRGGGAARDFMSEERKKLYDEQRCFRCREKGHTIAGCPVPPASGKEPADS